jgi:hypothetical protein
MVEGYSSPAHGAVAAGAIGSKAAFMLIVLGVAAYTSGWGTFEGRRRVT